jgi:hypothetical protein
MYSGKIAVPPGGGGIVTIKFQMKSWAGEALETVNCCAFLQRRLIGGC